MVSVTLIKYPSCLRVPQHLSISISCPGPTAENRALMLSPEQGVPTKAEVNSTPGSPLPSKALTPLLGPAPVDAALPSLDRSLPVCGLIVHFPQPSCWGFPSVVLFSLLHRIPSLSLLKSTSGEDSMEARECLRHEGSCYFSFPLHRNSL